jgi:hypothetical protein
MAWMRMPGQMWPGAAAAFLLHVGRDDGGDDANAVALPLGRRPDRRDACSSRSRRTSRARRTFKIDDRRTDPREATQIPGRSSPAGQ